MQSRPAVASNTRNQNLARTIASAFRVHQWTKNLLVFAAPVLAHRLDAATLLHALQSFAALSLASSATYIFNDLCDLKHDRSHPTKRDRAFASGALPYQLGWVLCPTLIATSVAVAFWTNEWLAVWVLGYTGATVAYSAFLKRVLALDVVLLATFYAARLLAGGIATGIRISPPALAFAVFLFFSIALMKRFAELHNRRVRGSGGDVPGRPYRVEDLDVIAALGAASGMVSVFVIAVYLSGDDVRRLYRHPDVLWVLCLLILLWLSRMWIIANRGEMNEDPVLFAIRDAYSLAVAAGVIALIYAAV